MNQILKTKASFVKHLLWTTVDNTSTIAEAKQLNSSLTHQKPNNRVLNALLKKTMGLASSQTMVFREMVLKTLTGRMTIESTENKTNSPAKPIKKLQLKAKQQLLRIDVANTIEDQTRVHCVAIKKSSSVLVKAHNLELLNKHLYEHNEARDVAIYDENLIDYLKKFQANGKATDKKLNGQINECLALLGCVPNIRRRGVNILSLDGGGAKGLVTIEILKNIQKKCNNKPIYELFDYISGTSTGAVIACLLGIYKFSLDECEAFYKLFAKELFSRNTAVGLSNLLMQKSFYDTNCWENILKEVIDDRLLIESTRDPQTPRISIVANMLSDKLLKIFLFRNYTTPLNTTSLSHFDGTHKYRVRQAVRATSAAPFYYEDYKIEGYLFNDGGLLANNPTSIAIHECKQLWPNHKIQSVTSIGNGRFYKTSDYESLTAKCDSLSAKQKVGRIVAGVINTENVHTVLHDLLPPKVYFRFNPYMSEEFNLDENRDDKWQIMQHDTQMYMRRNDHKFNMVAKQLMLNKTPLQRIDQFLRSKF